MLFVRRPLVVGAGVNRTDKRFVVARMDYGNGGGYETVEVNCGLNTKLTRMVMSVTVN